MGAPTPHPPPDRLAAFAAGRVDDAELDAVGRHLADCPACCDRVAGAAADPMVARLRVAAADPVGELPGRVEAVRAIRAGLLRPARRPSRPTRWGRTGTPRPRRPPTGSASTTCWGRSAGAGWGWCTGPGTGC